MPVLMAPRKTGWVRPSGPARLNRNSPQFTNLRCIVNWHYGGTTLCRDMLTGELLYTGGSGPGEYRAMPEFGNCYGGDGTSGAYRLDEALSFTPNPDSGTVVAWIYPFQRVSNESWTPGSVGDFYGDFLRIGYAQLTGNAYATLRVGGVSRNTPNYTLPVATWACVAARFDRITQEVQFWANGAQRGNGNDITSLGTPSFQSYYQAIAFLKDVQVAESRYYDRRLSDDELWHIYDPTTRWDLYTPVAPPKYWVFPSGATADSDNQPAFLAGSSDSSASKSAFLEGDSVGELLRPDGDLSSSGDWTNQDDGAVLFSAVDETTPSDTDYIQLSDPQVDDYFEVSLTNPGGTVGAGWHILRYRFGDIAPSVSVTFNIEVRQGGTTIATRSQTAVTSGQTLSFALTAGEVATITDYSDLRVRFTVTAVS